ncbi:hypothetical protein [Bradymonas sediminis]|uniref:Uncharacterized protein n=1 Tax=Bradymonas sediminis TaxID=1548548 RepID=A0A2Z4FH42_9DELT|nr:hypothetical protein [Bradymonas sediminis]AWV88048.1 hypothetical protein DN745_01345 [Bradymonas sediminis]TDP77171.1 hypothetical protein DFR33_10167 [Bradymonas sediminis]
MKNTDTQTDATSAESKMGDPAETDSPPARVNPAHEEFVSEVDRQFGRAYSRAGLSVLAALALFLGLTVTLFGTETLGMARLWIGVVLVFLVSLFVVRIFVVRRALDLLAKIQHYCLANQMHIATLRSEQTKNGAYQFFTSVFEVAERRGIAMDAPLTPEAPAPPAIEPSEDQET